VQSYETCWRALAFHQTPPSKFLNNIVEQDHQHIKRLVRPGLGFKNFRAVAQTIAGYEEIAMLSKGQLASIPANDMKGQSDFIAALFSVA
jgi:transposase-like protein